MTACTEPGCTGTYEDGYCNVCGAPQAPTAPAPVSPAAGPSATSLLGTGIAGGGGTARPTSAAPGPDGDERSTRTGRTSSSRLATAALGSARTSAGVRARLAAWGRARRACAVSGWVPV